MLETIGLFILAGALAGGAAKLADFMMDYGHPFDWMRMRRARIAARKTGMSLPDQIEQKFAKDDLSFQERVQAMDEYYWLLAAEDKGFLGWICPYCLAGRFGTYVGIFILGAGIFYGGGMIYLAAPFICGVAAFITSTKI